MLSLLPKALSTSKKTLDNATILYNINIRPRVLTMENAALEKYKEYAHKTKAFYQENIKPKAPKIRRTIATECNKYEKELKNSFLIQTVSKSLPKKYSDLFVTVMPPISHIAKKAIEERKNFNMQKFKEEVVKELKATAITEATIRCAKNTIRKLPPSQQLLITTAVGSASDYLVNNEYINKEISRQKEIIKKEADEAIKKANEFLNKKANEILNKKTSEILNEKANEILSKKANENKGAENSANRGCRY